ncbi:MAG: glycine cleavage system protein GcvH [Gammaproteobacteria bacterium]|nr:glycine cleavage system protein GcvH [Gammaproteobacteria bacterium]
MQLVKFTNEHEWLRLEDDGHVTVGITDYAQEQLGDIVYVELPEVGNQFDTTLNLAIIESVKAVGEIKMPLAGAVVKINTRLADEPELVNRDPQGEGWLLQARIEDPAVLDGLMDAAAYAAYLSGL